MSRIYLTIFLTLLIVLAGTNPAPANPLLNLGKLSLELSGVPVTDALNMIASQNNLNLVVSGAIDGEVTLHLTDVDVGTALDAILTALGYTYYVQDDVIVVKSVEIDVAAELISRTIRLNYLDPVTAKKALDSRLSDKGQIIILDKQTGENQTDGNYHPNRIFITERPNNMEQLVGLITELDIPERMILIEVKIIETKIDNSSKIGFQWPSSFGAKISGVNDGTATTTKITTSTSNQNLGVYDLNSKTWAWGKLSVDEVSLVLDLLMRDGNSRILSDPRVTTAENYEAVISTQTVIPIQTINRFSEGAVIQDIVTFQDEEVGIKVTVTPRINEVNRITLEVNAVIEDIIGYTGPPDNQRPITTMRSVKTRVTVDNGETLALGGLIKEDEIVTRQRVPILGRIPLLGSLLFTHKSVEKRITDLTILITPHVL